ncbi:MAG: hypothetical protein WCX12_03690 [Candidatus Paceibacterota bacterium]|jgi:hypothetical protein
MRKALLFSIICLLAMTIFGCSESPVSPPKENQSGSLQRAGVLKKASVLVQAKFMLPMVEKNSITTTFVSLSDDRRITSHITPTMSPSGNYYTFEVYVSLPASSAGTLYRFKAILGQPNDNAPADSVWPDRNVTGCVFLNGMEPSYGNKNELYFKVYPNGTVLIDVQNDVKELGENIYPKSYLGVMVNKEPDGKIHQIEISVFRLIPGRRGSLILQPVFIPAEIFSGAIPPLGTTCSGLVSFIGPADAWTRTIMPNPTEDVYLTVRVRYYSESYGTQVVQEISRASFVFFRTPGYRCDYPGCDFPVFKIPAAGGCGNGKG